MNQSETIQMINTIQHGFDTGTIEYQNRKVWPVLRYYMALVLMKQEEALTNEVKEPVMAVNRQSTTQRMVQLLKQAINYPLKQSNFKNRIENLKEIKPQILFISPSFEPYPDVKEGKSYSRYLDPYFELMNTEWSALKVQLIRPKQKISDTFVPTFEIDEENFLANYNFKRRAASRLRASNLMEYHESIKRLNEFCSRNNIPYQFPSWIQYHLDEVLAYESMFTEIIKSATARVVFFECYYSPCLFGLVSACKQLNVPCVDIQHGNVDVNYLQWKGIKPGVKQLLPDYYWIWSEADAAKISGCNDADILKPVKGGNMWLRQFLDSSLSLNSEKRNNTITGRKNILVSLQYSFLLPYLLQIILPCIKALGSAYNWNFRMHPLNSTEERNLVTEQIGGFSNVKYRESSSGLLYEVLMKNDLHIVASSAVALEGLQFGLPTIIAHPQGADLYAELIHEKVFAYATTSEEMMQCIQTFEPSEGAEKYTIETSSSKALECVRELMKSEKKAA